MKDHYKLSNIMKYYIPLAIAVFANVGYQLCAKSIPSQANVLASLTITYAVATITAAISYFIIFKGNLFQEFANLNWISPFLGAIIIFLEIGFIYSYRVGWSVSTLLIVDTAVSSVLLLVAGIFFSHEQISLEKILGIAISLVGVFFLCK